MSEENRPFKTFRAGKMSVGLWRNEVREEDRIYIQYGLQIQKRYFDKQKNDWQTTKKLFLQDLPNLILCCQKAFEFISLTEINNDDNEVTAQGSTFEEDSEASQSEEQAHVDDMLDEEELPVI
jgi:hypothetical protein